MTERESPRIVVAPPGPMAKKVLAKDKKYISPSYTRAYPLVAKRGYGMTIEDEDGNRYFDFTAGVAVCNTGHCHPEIVQAIQEQSAELLHMIGTDFYYHHQSDLAEKLAQITPGNMAKKAFLANTGAESVEAAMKLARYSTRRPRYVGYIGAFHGRTMAALSITSSKIVQRRYYAPLLSEVTHINYPYCYRCVFNLTHPKCNLYCLNYLKDVLFNKTVPPEEVAALIIEPIQGEGGYVVPPPDYLPALRKLCDEFGILLVVDEVQSGMGRTGKMFAAEHWKVVPDITCIAKGIASGMPLSAIVAKASIMDKWVAGAHANTFGGNPVACAAAMKTIELLENGLVENARKMGDYFMKELNSLKNKYKFIGDVRGKGLMIGVEIVKDKKTRAKNPDRRSRIVNYCFKHGLIIMGCGDSSIRFSPPLIITKEDIDIALEIFEQALKKS
ncbi:MAG: acetyl ornithine aminotransferase family protein [Planctomycetes bacterium]|nr:acetyl ornithine aminotransferase family protein [Planctomycetota bacterium]